MGEYGVNPVTAQPGSRMFLLIQKQPGLCTAASFAQDLAGCTKFDAEAYRHSPRLGRFRDSLARLASPLL